MSDIVERCPFCGGTAEIITGEHSFVDCKIRCTLWSVEGPLIDNSNGATGAGYLAHNKKQAIAEWNRRTSAAEITRLRAEIASVRAAAQRKAPNEDHWEKAFKILKDHNIRNGFLAEDIANAIAGWTPNNRARMEKNDEV